MAPKPTVKPSPEVAATATLLFQAYMEENSGLKFQQVLEPLTGYQVEVTALVQAFLIEYSIRQGDTQMQLLAHNMALGAWLARKHAEHVLAHLASVNRPNGSIS